MQEAGGGVWNQKQGLEMRNWPLQQQQQRQQCPREVGCTSHHQKLSTRLTCTCGHRREGGGGLDKENGCHPGGPSVRGGGTAELRNRTTKH